MIKGTMKRNGRVFINRVPCLSLLIPNVLFLWFLCFHSHNEVESFTAVALLMDKIILRKQCYGSGQGRRNPFSFNGSSHIGDCNSGRNMSIRHHPLMGHRVGIIGGGLAGLSTAYHLSLLSPSIDITIIDQNSPGTGGASAVAGG